jgi:hypothetical protein
MVLVELFLVSCKDFKLLPPLGDKYKLFIAILPYFTVFYRICL